MIPLAMPAGRPASQPARCSPCCSPAVRRRCDEQKRPSNTHGESRIGMVTANIERGWRCLIDVEIRTGIIGNITVGGESKFASDG